MGSPAYPIPRNQMSETEQAAWRLFSKAVVGEWDECWPFKGATTSNGYAHLNGVLLYGEFRQYPYGHRTSWALFNGRWPTTEEVVQHVCDNPPCVNPRHLLVGSQADNVATRPRSGRWFGVGTGKLTPEQVHTIRHSAKAQIELAREFNVSQTTISRVISGKAYSAEGTPKPRGAGGVARPHLRKLSNEDVQLIRESKESIRAIAACLGVSSSLVHRVRNGTRYTDVP